jgi:DNA polymerase-3 subunit epsilon
MYRVLDTETTGLTARDEVLEIAIVDSNKQILFHSYVRPVRMTEWPKSQALHGITPTYIFSGNFPTLEEIKPQLLELLSGQQVVIYNSAYDLQYLPEVQSVAASVECCQKAFSKKYGEYSKYYGGYKWQGLQTAAAYVLHTWEGKAHSAVADCLATVAVWEYLTNAASRRAIDKTKKTLK